MLHISLTPRMCVHVLTKQGLCYEGWIDAAQSAKDLAVAIKNLCADPTFVAVKKWTIISYEGFGAVEISSEFEDLPAISAYAYFIVEYGEIGAAVLARYRDVELAEEIVSENYEGEYVSEEDFVLSFLQENGELPDFLHPYIDSEKMAKEWFELNYFVVRFRNRCHVFRR